MAPLECLEHRRPSLSRVAEAVDEYEWLPGAGDLRGPGVIYSRLARRPLPRPKSSTSVASKSLAVVFE